MYQPGTDGTASCVNGTGEPAATSTTALNDIHHPEPEPTVTVTHHHTAENQEAPHPAALHPHRRTQQAQRAALNHSWR